MITSINVKIWFLIYFYLHTCTLTGRSRPEVLCLCSSGSSTAVSSSDSWLRQELCCPAERTVDGPHFPPEDISLKRVRVPDRTRSHTAPVRPWTSRRAPVSSSITATRAYPAVGILKLRRLATSVAERRPELITTSRGFYTFSSMSGPASRWRGRSGRSSGPSCR